MGTLIKFVPATRKKKKLKIAFTGPSNSGKTLSALRVAAGIGKNIFVIDTENDSASLYSERVSFRSFCMASPFSIEKLVEAMKAAVSDGADVLIIDSLSHFWKGKGGLLEQKQMLDSGNPKANSFVNWAKITRQQERMIAAIIDCPIHTFVTMRSKTAYVLETNESGKQTPRKVGLEPEQRDGIEYEFDCQFDLSIEHVASIGKDRTGIFDGRVFIPDEEIGKELQAWLDSVKQASVSHNAEDQTPTQAQIENKPQPKFAQGAIFTMSEAQRARMWAIASNSGWSDEDCKAHLKAQYGIDSSKKLGWKQYQDFCEFMQKNPKSVPIGEQDTI